MSRRLLLITHHFGSHGATGGFRWRAMADALAAEGWAVDVVTSASGSGAPPSPPRGGRLVTVRTPAWGTWMTDSIAAARGAKRRVAASPGAPAQRPDESLPIAPVDPSQVVLWRSPKDRSWLNRTALAVEGVGTILGERAWGWAAGQAALGLAAEARPDLVVVSTPPHVSSLAAVRVAARLGVPSVVDLRDPWMLGIAPGMDFHTDDVQERFWRRWELDVMTSADVVVHNTTRARDVVVGALGARRRARHEVVANGYEAGPPAGTPDRSVFRVSFTGWIHPVMDVRVLLDACGRLRQRHDFAAGTFEVSFMGCAPDFGGVPLAGLAAHYGLADVFRLRPRGTRDEALAMQEGSAVLCAMDYRHPMAVPMKFYDYAQMRGAMLLIGTTPSALADAAGQLGLPVFGSTDRSAIDAYLDEVVARWRAGALVTPADPEGRFRRDRQTAHMVALLGETVAAARPISAGTP